MPTDLHPWTKHGFFRTSHENGQPCEEGHWEHGREHGVTRQYDVEGQLIGSYTMDHGTGVDLWFEARGVLSESRALVDGERHGFERWWRDNATVWKEGHFRHGQEHGIFREWNGEGRLRRGFPRYRVDGLPVDKRRYLRACRDDAGLPPFAPSENLPQREPPAEAAAWLEG